MLIITYYIYLMNSFKEKIDGHVVRATFSLPHDATEEIKKLVRKFGQCDRTLNKSEVVRIGLATLKRLNKNELQQAADRLVKLKSGRPPLDI